MWIALLPSIAKQRKRRIRPHRPTIPKRLIKHLPRILDTEKTLVVSVNIHQQPHRTKHAIDRLQCPAVLMPPQRKAAKRGRVQKTLEHGPAIRPVARIVQAFGIWVLELVCNDMAFDYAAGVGVAHVWAFVGGPAVVESGGLIAGLLWLCWTESSSAVGRIAETHG